MVTNFGKSTRNKILLNDLVSHYFDFIFRNGATALS